MLCASALEAAEPAASPSGVVKTRGAMVCRPRVDPTFLYTATPTPGLDTQPPRRPRLFNHAETRLSPIEMYDLGIIALIATAAFVMF
jgi:hypothetical protein